MNFHVPEDPAIQALLGIITVRHAHLEYVLRMTIKTLTGMDIEKALDATDVQGPAEIRERIKRLARQELGEGKPLLELQALITRCKRATKTRNSLIHNLWAIELDGKPQIQTDDRKWAPIPTFEELDKLADELLAVRQELNDSRFEGGFLYEALQAKKT